MSLRTKSLLYTLTSVVALLVAFSAVLRWVVVGGFKASEESSTVRRVEELESLVGTVLVEFGQRFEDWSSWDAVSDFASTKDPEFIKENVSYDNLKVTLDVQFMAIVRADGTVVLGAWCESARRELGALPNDLLSEVAPGGLLSKGLAESGPAYDGVLMIGGKPYSVTSRPVLRTDKTKPATAARFIVGRAMDGAWVERLERFSFTKLSLTPSKQEAAEPTAAQGRSALAQGSRIAIVPRENEVHGFVQLSDLRGDSALVLEVIRPRELSHHTQATLNQSTATSAIAGLLLVGVFGVLLHRLVQRPLAQLLAGVRQVEQGRFEPVAIRSRDEIGELGRSFNAAIDAVARREASLVSAQAHTQLILDSAGDGFVGLDPSGQLVGLPSAALVRWFGQPSARETAAEYLFGEGERRAEFEQALEQVAEGALPFEVAADQLPKSFERNGRHFCLELRQGHAQLLVLVIRDVTLAVERERDDAMQREVHGIMKNALRDAAEFRRFIVEVEGLLQAVERAGSQSELARPLHTLKGTLAVAGFQACSAICHQAEDALKDEGMSAAASLLASVRATWDATLAEIRPFLGKRESIDLSPEEHRQLLARLSRAHVDARTVQFVEALAFRPAEGALSRLAEHAGRLATRLNKPVAVVVEHAGVRIPPGPLDPFCEALVHVVRNAIDHGFESRQERLAAGKSAIGSLELLTRIEGPAHQPSLVVEVRDDGAGIDFGAVRKKALALGIPFEDSERGLTELMFTDGFSTRDDVTDTSGRGVGLSALKASCTAAGGEFEIVSQRGKGTSFIFRFTTAVARDVWAPTVPPPSNGRQFGPHSAAS